MFCRRARKVVFARALRRATLGGILTAGLGATLGPLTVPASNSVPTYTWTGADVANGHDAWSDPGNWQGGIAPASGSTINVTFAPACDTSWSAQCPSINDISGLVVDQMSIDDWRGQLSGDPITLNGLSMQVTSSYFGVSWNIPVSLGQAQSWSLSCAIGSSSQSCSSTTLTMTGDVTGAVPLTIDLLNGFILNLEGDMTLNAGVITVTDSGGVGPPPGSLVIARANMNTDGNPINVSRAAVVASSGTTGPLSIDGGALFSDWITQFAPEHLTVEGNLALKNSSFAEWAWLSNETTQNAGPGDNNSPEIDATGSVSFGSTRLSIGGDCNMPVGTSFVLFDGAAGESGQFTSLSGQPIYDGALISGDRNVTDSTCDTPPGGSPPPAPLFRISYTATQVLATVASAFEITTTSLPSATVVKPYRAELQAVGGTTPYTWSLAGGSLPRGLALSPSGVISGTPVLTETCRFTIKVTDASDPANTATATLSISVGAGGALDPTLSPFVAKLGCL